MFYILYRQKFIICCPSSIDTKSSHLFGFSTREGKRSNVGSPSRVFDHLPVRVEVRVRKETFSGSVTPTRPILRSLPSSDVSPQTSWSPPGYSGTDTSLDVTYPVRVIPASFWGMFHRPGYCESRVCLSRES